MRESWWRVCAVGNWAALSDQTGIAARQLAVLSVSQPTDSQHVNTLQGAFMGTSMGAAQWLCLSFVHVKLQRRCRLTSMFVGLEGICHSTKLK